MTRLLKDQVVVITGAGTGIGREAALRFAEQGARVVAASRNAEALETLVTQIRRFGGRAIAVPTDVTRPEEVERLAETAEEHFGRIDTWVNNAAVSFYATFEQASIEEMRHQMEVNYWGYIYGIKAALPRLKKAGGGTVILVTSALSDFAIPLQGTYCAAKHALRAIAESLRIELKHDQAPIHVSLIKPPSVDTPFFRHARTKLGVLPKPVAPVYDPWVIAEEIVRAAGSENPPRELLVGGAPKFFSLIHQVAPSLFEWHQARFGYQGQMTKTPKGVEEENNFYAPVEEEGAERDTGKGWKVSWVQWLQDHPKAAAAAGVAAAAAVVAVRRR